MVWFFISTDEDAREWLVRDSAKGVTVAQNTINKKNQMFGTGEENLLNLRCGVSLQRMLGSCDSWHTSHKDVAPR